MDLEKYTSKLKGMGEVYTVQEGGRTKVRLGVFANKTEASAAQQKARDRGFKGAFTVSEKERKVSVDSAISSNTKTQSSEKSKATKSNAREELNGYLVRLAAYSNLDYFNSGTVDDLGFISYLPKGGVTLVLLGGYDSKDSAFSFSLGGTNIRASDGNSSTSPGNNSSGQPPDSHLAAH